MVSEPGPPHGHVRVGVSGWVYRAWRGDFYPDGLVQRRELEYVSTRLSSVEINGTFYSLRRPSTFQSWHDSVGDDFVFAVKGGRFVTHLKRLKDPEQGLANFFASGVLALGRKTGPFLWQLPASVAFDPDTVDRFCRALPSTMGAARDLATRTSLPPDRALTSLPDTDDDIPLRHALEPRHESFSTREARSVVAAHEVATVVSDNPDLWPVFHADTAPFRYVRLHGHTDLYTSSYSASSLRQWAQRCVGWAQAGQDVYVYFDNDARGHAPHNAVDCAALVAQLTSCREQPPQPA